MSPSLLLYFLGMVLIGLGERVVGEGTGRWVLLALGLAAAVAGLGLAARSRPAVMRLRVMTGAVGLLGLAVYGLGSDTVVDALAFADDDTEHHFRVVISALWPIVWLAGALPFWAVERALVVSPVAVVAARVQEAAVGALSLSFAISMLFPLNYLAVETNQRWDFGYFKTARPGTSTQALVSGLDEPMAVYLFFPNSSDVTDELRTYFDALDGDNLVVSYVDHALEPELSKELKIRDNGYIALVRGEGDDQQIERINIGKTRDGAKRKLKKLDGEVRESLLKVARGKRVAYFTTGHGELYWKSGTDVERKIGNLKKILGALNIKVKELGLSEGLGNEVPEDASLVAVLGPQSAFLDEEISALDRYRQRGGPLLVAMEPGGPELDGLLHPMGLNFDGTVTLANDTKFIPRTRGIIDRVNIFSNKFSSHESVTTLSRNSKVLYFIAPSAGALTEKKIDGEGKTRVTVRSLPDTWGDKDGDLTFDDDTENRKTWNLAVAAHGPVDAPVADGPEEYRAVVMADATWASDLALPLDPSKANFQIVLDSLAWLTNDAASAGTIESEEDVKLEHTREGQGWLFYGTAAVMPAAFLLLGLGRISLRRRRSAA